LWVQFDTDNSGTLQKNEARVFVQHMMKDMGCDFDENQFEECFKEIDLDGNGTIEKKEMANFIKQIAGLNPWSKKKFYLYVSWNHSSIQDN